MRTIDVWYARVDVERQVADWGRRLTPTAASSRARGRQGQAQEQPART
jgi:hypothetical protein